MKPITIVKVATTDVRFPTSDSLDGSDSLHTAPDYSATYVRLVTDRADGVEGHGITFTNGRGNEVCATAVAALRPLVEGLTLEEITSDFAGFWRKLTNDGQLRWLGPEKGVIHLATAALVNAVWDLYAKVEGKPLWKLLVDLSPQQIVDAIDFRYIADAVSPEEALAILEGLAATRADREAEMLRDGYPAYNTSVGWLGYSEDKVRALCRRALDDGWNAVKMKVGLDTDENVRRAKIIRDAIGPENKLMMDANQCWDVAESIANMRRLAQFDPWWIEEPTSPDDVLGQAAIAQAIAPIAVASGEHCQNRVMFKQFMQAGAMQFCQVDGCRLGGVNEVLAVLLLAARFGVPVCPHTGGVGLCELMQHIAIFDYIAVSGSLEKRTLEYVDHLHEHFVNPVRIVKSRYQAPTAAGYSITMREESLERYAFPSGEVWRARR